MIYKLFDNPYTGFLVVATVITVLVLLPRLLLKRCVLLWKSTLISYVIYVAFATFMYIGESWQMKSEHAPTHLFGKIYYILGPLLLIPGMLIYGLVPGAIKMCPSNFDEFGVLTCAFLFYAIVIWGIMKVIKQRKEMKTVEKKQGDNAEKQPL
jgi:hypothetical protein